MSILPSWKIMERDLSTFSIDQLLDAIHMLRTDPLDAAEWKAKMSEARAKIVAELELRPSKDLAQALIHEAKLTH